MYCDFTADRRESKSVIIKLCSFPGSAVWTIINLVKYAHVNTHTPSIMTNINWSVSTPYATPYDTVCSCRGCVPHMQIALCSVEKLDSKRVCANVLYQWKNVMFYHSLLEKALRSAKKRLTMYYYYNADITWITQKWPFFTFLFKNNCFVFLLSLKKGQKTQMQLQSYMW